MKAQPFTKGNMKKNVIFSGILMLIMLLGQYRLIASTEITSDPGQLVTKNQWTDQQKEVWNAVETFWKLFLEEDLEEILKLYHPDFRGWTTQDPLPVVMADEKNWLAYIFQTEESLNNELKPAAIDIHDNFAFVHYYSKRAFKDLENKHKIVQTRWTDIYTKKGNTWLLISYHGGIISEQ